MTTLFLCVTTSIRPNFLILTYISFTVFPVKCSYYGEKSLNHLSASLSVLYRQQKNIPFNVASVILILLILGGVEANPGPANQGSPKIISINCRGLSNKVKLLSSIGKLRKECDKNDSCIIFMQETHLDDVNFISNVWQDT